MPTVWFILIAGILTAYVLLDGFDLGAGAVYLFVTKDDKERQAVLKAILPVWDGNEVFLVAAGGALLVSFPLLYASSLSGFYIPIFVVFWLLMLRGVGIEMRETFDHEMWRAFWDFVFFAGSLPLPFFFGVALANVMRGVPVGKNHYFFQPLWTDPLQAFSSNPGILDWFTVLIGFLALAALVMHGTAYLAVKTLGGLRTSCRIVMGTAWLTTACLTGLATPLTFHFLPRRFENFVDMPWGFVFPAVAVVGLLVAGFSLVKGWDRVAFGGSCAYIAGMISSTAFAIYPNVLPAADPRNSITISQAAASHHSLVVGLIGWGIGLTLACGYFGIVYWMFRGKVEV